LVLDAFIRDIDGDDKDDDDDDDDDDDVIVNGDADRIPPICDCVFVFNVCVDDDDDDDGDDTSSPSRELEDDIFSKSADNNNVW